MPPPDRPLPLGHEDLELPRYRRDSDEEAEERGHRLVHCRKHNFKGWSDDCGVPECCYGDREWDEKQRREEAEDE